jgi:hypothetical protein
MAGQGTNILALDYNNIQSKIGQILGTGAGNYGYNQTVLSGQVAVNQKITAVQWQNLYNDLISARTHQTNANETGNLTYPTTSTQIKESDRAAYQSYVNVVDTNRLITPPSGQATLDTYATGTRSSAWNGTITHSVTVTFADANTARGFFNAGGNIQISGGHTPDTSTLKNNSWQTMLVNMGVVKLTYSNTTNTGSATGVTTTSIGFYQLTTTPQLIFRKLTEQSLYSPNEYAIYANINGPGTAITFSIQFIDLSTGTTENTQASTSNPFREDENVTGTLISLVQGYRPSGASVSIATPTASQSGP